MISEFLDLSGRILYLSEDDQLIQDQLSGLTLSSVSRLRSNVSTDEIIPARFTTASVSADQLGKHLLRGLKGVDQIIKENQIAQSNIDVIVAGKNFGSGSSREHVQHALRGAGIKAVFAESWAEIFGDNNIDWGIPTLNLNLPEVQNYLNNRIPIPTEVYLKGLGAISRQIAESGGIVEYTRRRMSGEVKLPPLPNNYERDMNPLEKIIARYLSLKSVSPGEEYNILRHWVYLYDLQAKDMQEVIDSLLSFGLVPPDPQNIKAFEDHLALVKFIKPGDKVSDEIRTKLRRMSVQLGIQDYKADPLNGAAICHTKMAEDFIEPGQIVVGNDSHTNSEGFMGALALAKGSTRTAVSIFTGDTFIKVPEVIKVNLVGDRFPKGVHFKDLSLYLGGSSLFKEDRIAMGRALFFDGPVLNSLPADELFVGANMSRENLAEYGFFLPTQKTLEWIKRFRTDTDYNLSNFNWMKPDPNAQYSHIIDINLDQLEPMLALPGDPQNAIPLSQMAGREELAHWIEADGKIHVDIVYIGSCMGGTLETLRVMSEIIEGRSVNPDIKFYYQAASPAVLEQAIKLRYIEKLDQAGAIRVPYGCGACFGSGPGSTKKGERAVFGTNRNLKSRNGDEPSILTNEEVGVATAINGYLSSPEDLT